MDGRGAAHDRAVDEAGDARLEVAGPETVRATTRSANPGAWRSSTAVHPLDVLVELGVGAVLPVREVGVRPQRLGPGRRARGVGEGHLSDEQERVARVAARRDVGAEVDEVPGVTADMHGAGPTRLGGGPGHRGRQRPVDLEHGVVPGEALEVGHHARGEMLGAHEVAIEQRRRDVGEYRTARPDQPALGVDRPDRPSALHQDPTYGAMALHHSAPGLQPVDERLGQRTRSTLGDGETDVLGEHRQQPAEDRTARLTAREIGVQRVALHQEPGAFPGELLLGEARRGHHQPPRQPEQVRSAERADQPTRGPHRRERAERRSQQRLAQSLPLGGEPSPGVAVAASEAVHGVGGHGEIAREQHRPVIGQHVGQRIGWMAPPEAVRLEVEPAQDGGGAPEGVEGAAEVVAPPRCGDLRGPHGTARGIGGLENQHRPAGVGQQVGRDEAVVAGADDDGVDDVLSHRGAPRHGERRCRRDDGDSRCSGPG